MAFDRIIEDKDVRLNSSADELLEKAKEQYDHLKALSDIHKETVKGMGCLITLKDGEFTSYWGNIISRYESSGKYKLDDRKIPFEYEQYTESKYDYSEIGGWSDNYSPKYYDNPTVNTYKAGENDKNNNGIRLEKLNETGTYFDHVGPRIFYCNNLVRASWKAFPLATGSTGSNHTFMLYSSTNKLGINSEFLEKHGEFLCTKTAGWELTDDYTPGNNFTVEYTPSAIFDDWYAELDPDVKKRIVSSMEQQLGIKISDKTKIEFSDGKWTWLRLDGSVISSGEYSESSKYKGFIVIKAFGKRFEQENAGNEYIYIEDGKIYYPYSVKMS